LASRYHVSAKFASTMANVGSEDYVPDDQPDLALGRLIPRLSSATPIESGITSEDDEFELSMDGLSEAVDNERVIVSRTTGGTEEVVGRTNGGCDGISPLAIRGSTHQSPEVRVRTNGGSGGIAPLTPRSTRTSEVASQQNGGSGGILPLTIRGSTHHHQDEVRGQHYNPVI
jgi:hypothetical protein